ncbi:MAG: Flp pilus assembly protein CpaB [Thermoguttaceae bacterium]
MSMRAVFVVILAIAAGVSAAIGVNHIRPAKVSTISETTPIVVATVDIQRGRMLTESDIKIKEYPKQVAPENSLTKLEDAVDRAAAIPIPAGDILLESKLATKEAGRGLAALVPKGMRAYTIQTSRVASSVAGFVLPGNKVDILLNLKGRPGDATGGGSTTTLLQSVEILAVDQRLDAPTENKVNPKELSSVTLLVSPQQAALLDLGQNLGQLTLSLRNPDDGKQAEAYPATLADIRFHQEKPLAVNKGKEAAKVKLEFHKITTLRGSHFGCVSVALKQ